MGGFVSVCTCNSEKVDRDGENRVHTNESNKKPEGMDQTVRNNVTKTKMWLAKKEENSLDEKEQCRFPGLDYHTKRIRLTI